MNLNFIWKNNYHYIRKEDMVKEFVDCGGNVIDLKS